MPTVKILNELELGLGGPQICSTPAGPEGSVTAPPGSLCLGQDGMLYQKPTGTGNVGWQPLYKANGYSNADDIATADLMDIF